MSVPPKVTELIQLHSIRGADVISPGNRTRYVFRGCSRDSIHSLSPGVSRKPKPLATFTTKGWNDTASSSKKPIAKANSIIELSDSSTSSAIKRTSSDISMVPDELSPPPKRVKKAEVPPYSFGKEILNVPPVAGHSSKGKGKAVSPQETFMEVDSCGSRGTPQGATPPVRGVRCASHLFSCLSRYLAMNLGARGSGVTSASVT